MNLSVRTTVIFWLCVPLVLAAALLLFDNYRNALHSANSAYDNALYASALAIADRVVLNGEELEVDLPYIALEMLSAASEDHVYYKVVSGDGSLVTGYKDLPSADAEPESPDGDAAFFESRFRNQVVRVAEIERSIQRQSRRIFFDVVVAQTVGERDKLARELTVLYGSRYLLLVIVVIAAAWISASMALKPLKRLQHSLEKRSNHDLTPIAVSAAPEIDVVVAAINRLMERLRESFIDVRALVDDASHQLRTPIASLKTQIEVALAEDNPEKIKESLNTLLETANRTGRLAEQLLTHTKTSEMPDFESTNLSELIEGVVRGWVIRALESDIDLGLEHTDDEICIACSPTLLEEALNNLLHNAIQYCPAGASVTVRLYRSAGKVNIEVEDNGPGIAEADRSDALKRFRRINPADTIGCGLGLAIAAEVVELHNGKLSLHGAVSGSGLKVLIEIPDVSRAAE